MISVGIDISKDKSTVCMLRPYGEVVDGYDEDEMTVDTWFDAAGLPVRAAVSYQGQTLLKAELRNFSLERGNQNENSQKNMGGGVSG